MKKNLNICFVTEDFYPNFIGGQGIYGFNLVKELGKMGCQVVVLAEDKPGRREFWDFGVFKGVRVLLVPFCFGNQLILALAEYLLFKFRCSSLYFDIVHANQLSGLFFVLLRPKNVGKIIVSAHNTNYDMAQKTDSRLKRILYQPLIWLERIVYKRADGLIFNSPLEEKELINYYKIKIKTKSIYPGVNMPKIKRQRKANKQKIVLYVGRLVKRKKVDTLIRAIKLLKNVKLLIIGKGVEEAALKRMANRNVEFLGFVEDTNPYFLGSDLFVTVSEAEGGFLLSGLEAASFGLPLILSESAAGFPIIKEGRNGYICTKDDPEELARLIKRVIGETRIIREMREESRKIAKQFSWNKCAKNTIDFYHIVLKKP